MNSGIPNVLKHVCYINNGPCTKITGETTQHNSSYSIWFYVIPQTTTTCIVLTKNWLIRWNNILKM